MATKIRVNITFDPDILRLADREARRRKVSRSQVVRDSIREAVARHAMAIEEEGRRKRRSEAAAKMDRLAREFGNWPADKIVRAARDRWADPLK